MTSFDQLSHSLDEQRAAAARRRSAAQVRIRSIVDTASLQGRSNLSPQEDVVVDELLGQRDSAARELRQLDSQVDELRAAIADENAVQLAQRQSHPVPGLPVRGSRTASIHVGREQRQYGLHNDPSGKGFLNDVARQFLYNDPAAQQRLVRHMAEERVERPGYAGDTRAAGDSTTSNWAGLTVPQYLTDLYAMAIATMRPPADNATHHELPPSGMTINISQVTTPAQVALVASELPAGGVAAQSIDDTLLTENVQTAAGQVTLSRQAIDRGTGIDDVTAQDLFRRYASTLDSTLINQSVTGISALAQNTVYTDASPTPQLLWPNLFKAQSALEQALEGIAIPDFLVMHSRRWNWFTSTLGSTWPLIGGSNTAAQQGGVVMSNEYGSGVRGVLPNGMKIIVDNNVPTNLGVGTNQDEIYCVAHQEVHLWEDPNAPILIRAEQPAAPRLGVLLVAYGYFAYTVRRFANGVGKISGTGLVAPAGF